MYRLLRPELVKSNDVPLSSNALSKWVMDDSEAADSAVQNATRRLQEQVVPEFAKMLDEEASKATSGMHAEPLRIQLQSLVTEMHRRGYFEHTRK